MCVGAAAGKPIRAGYLGHLTHIANRLAEAATMRDAVAAALGATPAWGPWVDDTLRGRNDMENVLTWSCGLPSKREALSVPSVDELDAESHSFQVPADPPHLPWPRIPGPPTLGLLPYGCRCADHPFAA